jgi:hypothetical protein
MSNNLDIDQLSAGQSEKEITVNTATGQLDAALTEWLNVDLTSGDVTLTTTELRRNALFYADNVATSGRAIILPATNIKKNFYVYNPAASTDDITVEKGTGSITVGPGEIAVCHADGTTNGLVGGVVTAASGVVSEPFSVGAMCSGAPAASEKLLIYSFVYSVDIAANAVGSECESLVSATAQTDFLVKKNGSTIGTIRWAAAGTVATYVSFAATSFAAGDIIVIEAPASPDATLADIGFSLKMTRTST